MRLVSLLTCTITSEMAAVSLFLFLFFRFSLRCSCSLFMDCCDDAIDQVANAGYLFIPSARLIALGEADAIFFLSPLFPCSATLILHRVRAWGCVARRTSCQTAFAIACTDSHATFIQTHNRIPNPKIFSFCSRLRCTGFNDCCNDVSQFVSIFARDRPPFFFSPTPSHTCIYDPW